MSRDFPTAGYRDFPAGAYRDFPLIGGAAAVAYDTTLINTNGFIIRPTLQRTYIDLGTTNVSNTGDKVAQANDAAKYIYNSTQVTTATRPTWLSAQGLTFNGTSLYLTSPHSGNGTAGSFAVRARIATDQDATDTFIGNAVGTDRRWLSVTDGILSMGIGDLGSNTFQDTGATDLRHATNRHNMVGTYSGGAARLYLNGSEVGSSGYGGTVNVRDFYIGARNTAAGPDLYFKGDIICLMQIDRVLTATEVQSLDAYWDLF